MSERDTPRFFGIIRESFKQVHDQPVFQDLADQFKQQIDPKRWDDIPDLPETGTLPAESVLESFYSFA